MCLSAKYQRRATTNKQTDLANQPDDSNTRYSFESGRMRWRKGKRANGEAIEERREGRRKEERAKGARKASRGKSGGSRSIIRPSRAPQTHPLPPTSRYLSSSSAVLVHSSSRATPLDHSRYFSYSLSLPFSFLRPCFSHRRSLPVLGASRVPSNGGDFASRNGVAMHARSRLRKLHPLFSRANFTKWIGVVLCPIFYIAISAGSRSLGLTLLRFREREYT